MRILGRPSLNKLAKPTRCVSRVSFGLKNGFVQNIRIYILNEILRTVDLFLTLHIRIEHFLHHILFVSTFRDRFRPTISFVLLKNSYLRKIHFWICVEFFDEAKSVLELFEESKSKQI